MINLRGKQLTDNLFLTVAKAIYIVDLAVVERLLLQ